MLRVDIRVRCEGWAFTEVEVHAFTEGLADQKRIYGPVYTMGSEETHIVIQRALSALLGAIEESDALALQERSHREYGLPWPVQQHGGVEGS